MGDLETAVHDQIAEWGLQDTALAACALDLARRLDAGVRPTTIAALHAQLRAYLSDLQELAPPEEHHDEIDEVAAQREARRRAAGMA